MQWKNDHIIVCIWVNWWHVVHGRFVAGPSSSIPFHSVHSLHFTSLSLVLLQPHASPFDFDVHHHHTPQRERHPQSECVTAERHGPSHVSGHTDLQGERLSIVFRQIARKESRDDTPAYSTRLIHLSAQLGSSADVTTQTMLDLLVQRRALSRSLSLMTFNVLAPCYFRHGGRVESDDRAAFLSRAQALIHAIQRERCDLVCLQEYWFNREYQAAFRKAFYPSHYIHTLKRPGDKEDGLAIFVEKHKFEIHHVQHIDFDHAGDRVALLMHVATKWNRHDVPLMQRSFLVINSHLTFPHCQMYKDMRLDQIKAVLESVRDYVTRESLQNVPILMCGDFNDFNDPVHSLVLDEGFASVFAHVHGREARITHCNHNNREVGVDFIFASHLQGDASSRRRAEQLVVEDDGVGKALLEFEEQTSDSPHASQEDAARSDEPPRLELVPRECHLSPRNLTDETRLKRPSFGHDWRLVQPPPENQPHDEEALVDYWRMVSDHRPLIATFDVLAPGTFASSSASGSSSVVSSMSVASSSRLVM